MAKRTIVELVDDLDGGDAESTLRFAVDGVEYEMDLSQGNLDAFHAAVEGYVRAARRVGGRRGTVLSHRTIGAGTTPAGLNSAEIREWATANGYSVNDRGRIPQAIIEAFQSKTPASAQEAEPESEPVAEAATTGRRRGGRRAASEATANVA